MKFKKFFLFSLMIVSSLFILTSCDKESIIKDNELSENETVECTANTCKHNQNGFCTKQDLNIGGYSDAKYRSETQCNSFVSKRSRSHE